MLTKFSLNLIYRLLLFLLLSCNSFLPTIQISFGYNNFMNKVVKVSIGDCPEEWKNICLYGDADELDDSGVIDLTSKNATSGLEWSKGIAIYSKPMQLWNKQTERASNFRTEFSFIIKSSHSDLLSGDGLAFFISSFPYEDVSLSRGSGLGLVSIYNRFNEYQNNSFVAVELDTSHDFWDPSPTHVGIDVNSIRSEVYKNLSAGLKNSQGMVRVNYNSTTFNLSIWMDFDDDDSTPTVLSNIVDLKDKLPENVSVGFIAATSTNTEVNQILSWSFSSSYDGEQQQFTNNEESKIKRTTKTGLVIGLVFGIALSICSFALIWYCLKRKNKKLMQQQDPKVDDDGDGDEIDMDLDEELGDQNCPRSFSYQQLVMATDNFNENRKLGEGGFGQVYKGFLKEVNLNVAVKRISNQTKQGRKEYIAEVKIISQLRHKNLLRLIGWCHRKNDFIIVYELMENGSLDSYMFNHERSSIPWPSRYKIAQGLASGLLYLHEEGEKCIVHRDVKSSNVMLDKTFDAKLGDFGLARLTEHGRGMQTTFMAGTMGYIAPECIITGKCSKESDVYSFGIVALEIACGRKCIDNNLEEKNKKLVDWVWTMYGEGRLLETVDKRIPLNSNSNSNSDENDYDYEDQQIRHLLMVGLWCAHPDLKQRPSMTQVIAVLNLEAPLPNLPPMMPVPSFIAPPFTTISTIIGDSITDNNSFWSHSTSTNLR